MQDLYLKKAYDLAKKAIGFTSPNPAVGAVIVLNGKIIGSGFTQPSGIDHAEVQAIKSAKKSVAGATMYVTLEPCCHHGKTPPCTDLIISSGLKKVVVGMQDPFAKVNGQGIVMLKKNNITVEMLPDDSKLYQQIKTINQPFLKFVKFGLPYVVLKVAMTMDGKIATKHKESKWITGDITRKDARMERSVCDAVLVGAGTVIADNPELAPSGKYKNKKLLRIIVDGKLSSSLDSLVYRNSDVFVVTTDKASKDKIKLFKEKGIECKLFGESEVSIISLLRYLAKKGIQKIYVEGGSSIHGAFVDASLKNKNIIDQVIFYMAPKIIGGEKSLPCVGGNGVEKMVDALKVLDWSFKKVGQDFKITGFINRY